MKIASPPVMRTMKADGEWRAWVATLQIRSLDDDLYRALQEAARRDRRSLAQQAAATLAGALRQAPDSRTRRAALLAEIASSDEDDWPADLPSPVEWVREDRGL